MLYRLVYMSGKWISVEIDSVSADSTNIEQFASEGQIVVIVDDLESFRETICGSDTEIVEA